MNKPKIAIIDLLFSWPAKGGAAVDLYENFSRLSQYYDLKLFTIKVSGPFPRGINETAKLNFPFQNVEIDKFSKNLIVKKLKEEVTNWKPKLIYFGDAWTIKPYLINAFKDKFPCITRLYAYEMVCPRNNERWKFDHECKNSIFTSPKECQSCTSSYSKIVKNIRPNGNPLIEEFEEAEVNSDKYINSLENAFKNNTIIVYNQTYKKELTKQGIRNIHVIPGAVDREKFPPRKDIPKNPKLKLFVSGRMTDPAKGADTVIKSGHELYKVRQNFEIVMTRPPHNSSPPWLKEIGWISQRELTQHLNSSDIFIMPSKWQEAFGMSWVEAMSVGVPVISSSVAGPKDFIKNGINGLLFEPGNHMSLLNEIKTLIQNKKLRKNFVNNGFKTVKYNLTWDQTANSLKIIFDKKLEFENACI